MWHFIHYYAECRYAKCRYAECRGAKITTAFINFIMITLIRMVTYQLRDSYILELFFAFMVALL